MVDRPLTVGNITQLNSNPNGMSNPVVYDNVNRFDSIKIKPPPPPKWRVSFLEDTLVVTTPKNASWWFRFWTKFFFGAKWSRL